MSEIPRWLSEFSGNAVSVIVGVSGMFFAGLFGWLLRKPLIQQAIANEQYKSTITGLELLIKALQNQNTYLEAKVNAYEAHEMELIQQIRNLRQQRPNDD